MKTCSPLVRQGERKSFFCSTQNKSLQTLGDKCLGDKWQDCIYLSKVILIACDKCFISSLNRAVGQESWDRTFISRCGERGDKALGGRVAR